MSIMPRTSSVDKIRINIVAFASTLQIGDSREIRGLTRALAVQREAEIFYGWEGSFRYPIFSEDIPLSPVYEPIQTSTENINPYIKVGNIDILGLSTSSVVHIGNTCHIDMEARIKHIRQLLPR